MLWLLLIPAAAAAYMFKHKSDANADDSGYDPNQADAQSQALAEHGFAPEQELRTMSQSAPMAPAPAPVLKANAVAKLPTAAAPKLQSIAVLAARQSRLPKIK